VQQNFRARQCCRWILCSLLSPVSASSCHVIVSPPTVLQSRDTRVPRMQANNRRIANSTRSSAIAEITRVGGHYAVQCYLKVTNFDTNRKPACDFILLNNTNLHQCTLSAFSSYRVVFVKLSALTKRCLLLTHLFSVKFL